MISSLLQRPEWPLVVALAVGLLIGAERERRKGEGERRALAGVRTFALVGLLGGTTAVLGTNVVLLGGATVAVIAVVGYGLGNRLDPDLTGEVALVVTFVLGALAHTHSFLALEIGVVVAALLAYRAQIHRLVRETLTEQELLDGIAFAIAAVVILPMLPNRALDPFGLFNPFTLWRLVVVIMALSSFGYVAQRTIGVRYGLIAAGLAGGLVSATGAVATMAHLSRSDANLATASAGGAIASLLSSIGYMIALIAAVNPRLLQLLAPSLGAAVVVILGYAALLGRRLPTGEVRPAAGRAFNFPAAFLFVLIVAAFTLLSRVLSDTLGIAGALIGAGVAGLADAQAAAVSMATLSNSAQIADTTAALGVLVGLSTNILIKSPVAFALGTRAFAVRVSVGIGLMLASLWLGYGLTALVV